MLELPRAFGPTTTTGLIRCSPEDFLVHEELGFSPGDGGEHLWLLIRKRGWNTTDLALWLARQARLPLRAVGYSGLKDRNAVTEQWFSLHLPGKPDPDWSHWPDGLELLQSVRHTRKLNRGTHRSNRFVITVRELDGDRDALAQRLDKVAGRGVPNYFGEQRFGRGLGNWQRGSAWLRGAGEAPRKPQLRSIWLSAVRSGLFNAVLAERVRDDCWDSVLAGDVCQPEGSRGLFYADDDADVVARARAGTVHPTGPLPGVAGMLPRGDAGALEQQVLAAFSEEIAGLQEQGVEALRRALRLPVALLDTGWDDNSLTMTLRLPAGAFATAVLAELLVVRDASRHVGE